MLPSLCGLGASHPVATTFPLQLDPSGRFLRTRSGAPFRIKSEFAWYAHARWTNAQFATYLANRKARRFNAFEIEAIDRTGGAATSDTDGNAPFTTPGDFSTSNPAYFAGLRAKLLAARDAGFLVLLYPCYVGFDDSGGWYGVVGSNSTGQCQAYGTMLGDLIADCPNVILMYGGDRGTMLAVDGTLTKYLALFDAIKSRLPRRPLCGAEWTYPERLVTEQSGLTYGQDPTTTDIQLDSYYGQGPASPTTGNGRLYATSDKSWVRSSPVLPTFACETMQVDGTYVATPASDRASIRTQLAWAITAGSFSAINMGQADVASGDLTHLDDACYDDFKYQHEFFDALPWWKFAPSGTAGSSPHGSSGSSAYCGRVLITSTNTQNDSLISACMATDGSVLVAAIPNTGTSATSFNVDLQSMSLGQKTGWWFNPTTGLYTRIGAFDNSLSSQAFTTPGNNGTGKNDYLLLVN